MSSGRLTRYQPLLKHTLNIILKVCQILNPATLLLAVESGHLLHQCIKTLEQTYSSRSDLLDEPLDSSEAESLLTGAVL